MSTAVIGATGRVGSELVRGVLARGDGVAALVRDPDKARRAFGEPDGLHIRPTRLDDPRDVTEGLFRIHCCQSRKPPPCAYVAAKYRGYWFYIDDRDQASKESFTLVSLSSRLDFKRQRLITDGGPALTLPVGR